MVTFVLYWLAKAVLLYFGSYVKVAGPPCTQLKTLVVNYTRGVPATVYVFDEGLSSNAKDGLPLKFLADVQATEIHWRTTEFLGFQNVSSGLTNPKVQRIRFDVSEFSCYSEVDFAESDIRALLRFFPSLTRIEVSATGLVCANGRHLTRQVHSAGALG